MRLRSRTASTPPRLVTAISLLFFLTIISSCESAIRYACGELIGERRQYVADINMAYIRQLYAEQVPCYPDYLQLNCVSSVPSSIIDSIEATARPLGWIEVLVYDRNNILIRGNTGSM
jgi:hypothetical protein